MKEINYLHDFVSDVLDTKTVKFLIWLLKMATISAALYFFGRATAASPVFEWVILAIGFAAMIIITVNQFFRYESGEIYDFVLFLLIWFAGLCLMIFTVWLGNALIKIVVDLLYYFGVWKFGIGILYQGTFRIIGSWPALVLGVFMLLYIIHISDELRNKRTIMK